MSTMPPPPPTLPAPAALPPLDVSGTPPTPFWRLVKVEWRKMIDTRGGFWLALITAVLMALIAGITLLIVALNDELTISAAGWAEVFAFPISILMPVFAILIVTSEWSQRTALTTFTLEPNRMRVVAAKWAAVSIFAVLTIVVALLLGSISNLIGAALAGVDAEWNLQLSSLAWMVGMQLLYFWVAFALAMLLLNTPATIVVYYVVALLLPMMVWGTLFHGFGFGWAHALIPWIDLDYASQPLRQGATWDPGAGFGFGDYSGPAPGLFEYVRFGFAIVLWNVVPLVAGAARILRAEAK